MKPLLVLTLVASCLLLPAAHGEVRAPQPGTPLRQTILDDLRAAEPTASTQKEKRQEVVFDKVTVRVAGDWAWVSVAPRTLDGKWHSEMLTGLMHHVAGHWKVVEYLDDKVAASNSPKAYEAWRAALLKKNPECPPEVVPVRG